LSLLSSLLMVVVIIRNGEYRVMKERCVNRRLRHTLLASLDSHGGCDNNGGRTPCTARHANESTEPIPWRLPFWR
jgi:hypothetical protein